VVAPHARAQLNGVPVWPVGLPIAHAPRFDGLVALHTTSGDDFVGATAADPGFTLGVDQVLGKRFTLRTAAGLIRRDVAPGQRTTRLQAGALAAANLFRSLVGVQGSEVGASLLAGYGYGSLPRGHQDDLFLGFDLTVAIALGGVDLEPSLVPRWIARRTRTGTLSAWQDGPGITAALTFGFPLGLRLQVAGERIFLRAGNAIPAGVPEVKTYAWSAGIRYRL
jgi:hypothetical protein